MSTPRDNLPTETAAPAGIPPEPEAATADSYDETVRPIWEVLAEFGKSIPDEVWAEVPTDLSKRMDLYLYGSEESVE